MRAALQLMVALMLTLSSGAIVQLLKDGGARDEGFQNLVQYEGILNSLPRAWQVLTIYLGLLAVIQLRGRLSLDKSWIYLLGLCAASSIWADVPKATLLASSLLICSYGVVILQIRLAGVESTLQAVRLYLFFAVLLSVTFAFALPSYGVSVGDHEGKWQGIFDHKNGLGNFAATTLVFFLWAPRSEHLRTWGLALASICLLFSESTTGIVCGLLSVGLYLLAKSNLFRPSRPTHRTLAIACAFAVSCAVVYLSIGDAKIGILSKDTSFSNRNLVWLFFMGKIAQAPFLGHGLGQFDVALTGDENQFAAQVGFVVATAHNGFIEALYAVGLVGLLLSAFIIIKAARDRVANDYSGLVVGYLVNFIVLNSLESRLLSFNVYLILLMFISSIAARERGSRPG